MNFAWLATFLLQLLSSRFYPAVTDQLPSLRGGYLGPSSYPVPSPSTLALPIPLETFTSRANLERTSTPTSPEICQHGTMLDENPHNPPKLCDGEKTWAEYTEVYSSGSWARERDAPPMHPSIKPPPLPAAPEEVRNFGALEDREFTPDYCKAVFEDKGYFPAVAGCNEQERRRVLEKFQLNNFGRSKAIDRIAAITAMHFNCPLVVVSIVLKDKEIFASTVGFDSKENDEDYEPVVVPLETALCSHAMTRPMGSDCFVLEQPKQDWRFARNPYVRDGGLINFYAAANINLPTSSPDPSAPSHLPVGSLCLIDRNPRETNGFTPEHAIVLQGMAEMIGRELELAFEQERRTKLSLQTEFLGEFLRTSLVQPGSSKRPAVSPPSSTPKGGSSATFNFSSPPISRDEADPLTFQDAAQQLHELVPGSNTCVILDLRQFRGPFAPIDQEPLTPPGNEPGSFSKRRMTFTAHPPPTTTTSAADVSRWGGNLSGLAPGEGTVKVMGSHGDWDWNSSVGKPGTRAALCHSLMAFYSDGVNMFDSGSSPSPLSDILPPQTKASLSVPIFDFDGRPCLMLILCSFEKYFRFESADSQFVENVGAVAIGSLLRQRILEADRAKLAFVSQVSHELRTPLHAIGSQIELIRTVTNPKTLKTIRPLLDIADVCVGSLREILDDTLDWAKLSNATDASAESKAVKVTRVVSIEKVVHEVVSSCWNKTQQHSSISGDAVGRPGAGRRLDIILSVDPQLDDVEFNIDVGGMKRLLFNIIGNSLKFTTEGSIKVDLTILEMHEQDQQEGVQMLGIEIADTGIGMTEIFIREQLFVPFHQESSFSDGAGLGLSICDSIIKRMGGTLHFVSELGHGTVASIAVPLQVKTTPTPTPVFAPTLQAPLLKRRVRVLSDELAVLFDPDRFLLDATAELSLSNRGESGSETPRVSALSSAALTPLPSRRLKVLVVDDNPIGRKILTTYLDVKKIPFAEAADGLEAVEVFKKFRPDIIWTDLQMPNMDGLEATGEIRLFEKAHNLHPAYVVAVSGLSSESHGHTRVLETGQINEWIVKGGPSLKTLGQGLIDRQAELDLRLLGIHQAEMFQQAAQQIREGAMPDKRTLEGLSIALSQFSPPA